MNIHEKYMNRCIQLAKNGLGTTYPNPLVGSVIVYDDKIIGEGWHKKAGEAHAEVNAIKNVKDITLLKNATIYVSLEPCSHFGKTPPCSDLIIKHKIPHVVIGTVDPFSEVSGRGIEKLKNAGIKVTVGVLAKECQELNKRFFTFHTKKRPYIILKWAESADGFIAPLQKENIEPVWLSNIYSRQLVHKWRAEEQGIFVGTNTILEDNPKLDTRDWFGKSPIRITIDKSNKIPENFNFKDLSQETIVINSLKKLDNRKNLTFEQINFENNNINNILVVLFNYDIQSVIIEGGTFTLQQFIDSNLWDEARIFKSDIILKKGINTPKLNLNTFETSKIINNNLLTIKNYD